MSDAGGDDIDVQLFAGLERHTRDGVTRLRLPLADAPTLAALLERLGLQPAAAGLRLVNGLHAPLDAALQPGDAVALFPPLGGG
jgi:sulfur-carrier protein